MAGDWLKVEHATPEKPEVYAIADSLGMDPDEVVGKCFRVWCWYDQQSYDGAAPKGVRSLLEQKTSPEFIAALEEQGWLEDDGEGSLVIPNFNRHMGETAKERSQNAKRAAKWRAKQKASSKLKPKESKEWKASPIQLRINALFNRRATTPWKAKELRAFRDTTFEEQDLLAVERYYTANIPKAEDYRRRDLLTLLNNWPGEVDRANQFNGQSSAPASGRRMSNPQGY